MQSCYFVIKQALKSLVSKVPRETIIIYFNLSCCVEHIIPLRLSTGNIPLLLAEMTSTFDVEKERQNTESSVQSSITNAPSAADLESENHNALNDEESSYLPEKGDAEEPNLDDEAQYPHGFKLFIIVAALGMSIFLVALDMVCLTTPK